MNARADLPLDESSALADCYILILRSIRRNRARVLLAELGALELARREKQAADPCLLAGDGSTAGTPPDREAERLESVTDG